MVEKALGNPLGLPEVPDGPDIEVEVPQEGDSEEYSFTPEELAPPEHGDNLAEHLDEQELTRIAMAVVSAFDTDNNSREKWFRAYKDNLNYLGLESEDRAKPWPGASGIYQNMIPEAVVRFQAGAIKEIIPPDGPVKANIIGEDTPEKQESADRLVDYMNDLLMNRMPGYFSETERLCSSLAICGSAFRKGFYDVNLGLPRLVFVPAEMFIIPYGATDLETAPRYTEVMIRPINDVRKLMHSGFYRQVDVQPDQLIATDLQDKKDKLQAVESGINSDFVTLLECHIDLDIQGFEDTGDDDLQTGIGLPYVVTVDKGSTKILSIRKNWDERDSKRTKLQWYAPYEFVPVLEGPYAWGLMHLIGSNAKAATGILRQLIDAGTLSNLPSGFKTKGLRIAGDNAPIKPGEFRDVDAPNQKINECFMPLPYKEPSNVLLQLYSGVVDDGRRMASTADMNVGEASSQAPVGTTLALLEQAQLPMTGIQRRLHNSQKKEFDILLRIIKDNPPDDYPARAGIPAEVFLKDFQNASIVPVSDPNATTAAVKVTQFQAAITLAASAPGIYDQKELHRAALKSYGIKDVDALVPDKKKAPLLDPVSENVRLLNNEPVKAYLEQDHDAHIQVHMDMTQNPDIQKFMGQNPQAGAISAATMAHVNEHLGFKLRGQIEQKTGVSLPPPDQPLPPDTEAFLSKALAGASAEVLQEAKGKQAQQQAQQQAQDPIIQIQMREAAVKEGELQLKGKELEMKQQIEAAKVQSTEKVEMARVASQHETAQRAAQERDQKNKVGAALQAKKQQTAADKDKNKHSVDAQRVQQEWKKIELESAKLAQKQEELQHKQEEIMIAADKAKAEIHKMMAEIVQAQRQGEHDRKIHSGGEGSSGDS